MKRRIHDIRWVMFLLSIFLVFMFVMRKTASEVETLSGGQGVLDLKFAVTPDKISEALKCYSPVGRAFYRYVFLWVDFVYVLIYCTFYRSAIGYFCDEYGVEESTDRLLTTLPLVGAFSDILENNVLFFILTPNCENTLLFGILTLLNIIKFVFVYISFTITLGGFIWLAKKRLS